MEADHMTPKELLALREQADMSQEQVARLADVYGMTVSRWERGKSPISKATAQLLRRELKKRAKA
jgi:DNA-binding transcriptional regulator YiaG